MKKIIVSLLLAALALGTVCVAASAAVSVNGVSVKDVYLADGRVNGNDAAIDMTFTVPAGSSQTAIVVSTEDFSDIISADEAKIVYINQIDTPKNGAFSFPVVKDAIRDASGLKNIDGLKLYVKMGATGADSAAEYTLTFGDTALYGDLNSDGKVNSLDVAYAVRYCADWSEYDENSVNTTLFDLDADGDAGMIDAMLLARHIANWAGFEKFPYEN